jgi:hypothetical protein
MNWTLSKLKPEDWDFRPENFLADDDVEACYQWEFDREDEALCEAVAESRKKHPDYAKKYLEHCRNRPRTGQEFAALLASYNSYPPKPPPPLAYTIDPKWPDTPYRIVAKERRTRHDEPKPPLKANEKISFQPQFYAVIPWSFEKVVRRVLDKEGFPGEFKKHKWFRQTCIGSLWFVEAQSDFVAFEIPWHWPDSTLIKGFDKWLKNSRPQGKVGDNRPKVEIVNKPTGAAERSRMMRNALKDLGAYRLLRCYRGKRQQAKGHTDVTKLLGKNFLNDSAWTEAKKCAEWHIKRVSDHNKSLRFY